jgi:hypothetical protein
MDKAIIVSSSSSYSSSASLFGVSSPLLPSWVMTELEHHNDLWNGGHATHSIKML